MLDRWRLVLLCVVWVMFSRIQFQYSELRGFGICRVLDASFCFFFFVVGFYGVFSLLYLGIVGFRFQVFCCYYFVCFRFLVCRFRESIFYFVFGYYFRGYCNLSFSFSLIFFFDLFWFFILVRLEFFVQFLVDIRMFYVFDGRGKSSGCGQGLGVVGR